MKNLPFLLFTCFAYWQASAQQPVPSGKGATPIPPKSEIRNPKSVRAVVVGISDYQDGNIPDMCFINWDAEAEPILEGAFSKKSERGGGLRR